MAVVDEAKLRYLDFLSREDRVRHHRYVEEMKQYDMMRSGDINAIAESTRLWDSGLYGYLSDDPLKNAKYRFVTTITLATRFAIEGGMDEEDAYNASDLYIQNLENCKTPPACPYSCRSCPHSTPALSRPRPPGPVQQHADR